MTSSRLVVVHSCELLVVAVVPEGLLVVVAVVAVVVVVVWEHSLLYLAISQLR